MFREAISEAIQRTQFPGSHISILVEDPRFMTLTLQLPAMPTADLVLLLERKAQQEKTWEEPAAWRYYNGMQGRDKQNLQLEVWPQSFIDATAQICEELGLHLQQLAPISALLESQLSSLSVEPGEATILISTLEGNVMFVVGGEDGTPLLTRRLAPVQEWVPLGERIGTEVNRTIMFVNQQTNLPIPQIWFLGEEERLTLGEIQPHVATPILPCPVNPDWKYWLWVGATLSTNLPTNFTPPEVRRAPVKKLLGKTVAASIAILVFLGIGTTGVIEGYLAKNQNNLQQMALRQATLQQDQQHLDSQLVSLHAKQQWAQAITETQALLLEGPLLSYLSQTIPSEMVLYKASVRRAERSWELELTGSSSANLSSTLVLVDQLARELEDGPYHVRVAEGWRDQLMTQSNTLTSRGTHQQHYRWTLEGTLS